MSQEYDEKNNFLEGLGDLLSDDDLTKLQDDVKQVDKLVHERNQSLFADVQSHSLEVDALLNYEQDLSKFKQTLNKIANNNESKEEQPFHETESLNKIEPGPSAFEKLEKLEGLENIKRNIAELKQRLLGEKKLREDGRIKTPLPTLHMIFTGPPGTGKTEVARLYAEMLYELELLPTAKLIETTRNGLVGQFEGSTAPKTMAKLEEADGGVLFIDEAYGLYKGESDKFGKESIDILMKGLDDNRGNTAVILAGYTAEMKQLLSANPGLESRIPTVFKFNDYTPTELTNIAEKMLTSIGYECQDVLPIISTYIANQADSGEIKGNGRWVRNLIDRITKYHVIRISEQEVENIPLLLEEDVRQAISANDTKNRRTGLKEIEEDALLQLSDLESLSELKSKVKRFMDLLTVQKKRQEKGLTTKTPNMNMVFKGETGTGKSLVGKIIAQLLKGTGFLSNGHLIEVSKSDLIGQYQGQTPKITKEIVAQAAGGILFVNNAGTLNEDAYGLESLQTIAQEMEKYKGDLVVIFSGSEEEIDNLLFDHPILKSNTAYSFDFLPYSPVELVSMTKRRLAGLHFTLNTDAEDELLSSLEAKASEELGFIEGNGKWVENFIDQVQISQSVRIMEGNIEDLETLTKEDVIDAFDSN